MNIADIVPPNTIIKLERLRKTATLSVLMIMEPANRPKQPIIAMTVDIDIFFPNHTLLLKFHTQKKIKTKENNVNNLAQNHINYILNA